MNDNNIFYEHSSIPLLEKNLKSLCSEVLKHQSYNNYDISFIFVSDETLKEMKKKYFNQDLGLKNNSTLMDITRSLRINLILITSPDLRVSICCARSSIVVTFV